MAERIQAVTTVVEDVFNAYGAHSPLPGSIEVF